MAATYCYARWLERCCSLIGSGTRAWLYICGAHGLDFIRSSIFSRFLSADSPEFPDGYNLLFLIGLFDFIPSTDYITTDIDLLKALWTYDNNPKALDL